MKDAATKIIQARNIHRQNFNMIPMCSDLQNMPVVKVVWITSKLSERPFKYADQITERGKISNPEYNICRDQPTTGASPLRINVLLSRVLQI